MTAETGQNQIFGKYELRELIGHGGFGSVYRAYDRLLELDRAVKILHPVLHSSPEFINRFNREARLLARLDHPHIVPVYDLGQEQSRYYLVMKLMEGGSLSSLLTGEGRLDYSRVMAILQQIAAALDYAHRQKIIHRDIKPANILFEEDGTARLSDFGFARALSDSGLSSLSLSGGLIGTPSYMAPELWNNRPANAASDVYSLGCVVSEMLTGQLLFPGDSPAVIMTKHVLNGAQLPQSWGSGVPDGFATVLRKALAPTQEDRWQSAGAFYQALVDLEHAPAIRPQASVPQAETLPATPPPVETPPTPASAPVRALPGLGERIAGWRSAALRALAPLIARLGGSTRAGATRVKAAVSAMPKTRQGLPRQSLPRKPKPWVLALVLLALAALLGAGYMVYRRAQATGAVEIGPGVFSSPGAFDELYFTSTRGGSRQVYRQELATGSAVRITDPKQGECWMPRVGRGNAIFMTCNSYRNSYGRQIYRLDPQTGELERKGLPVIAECWEPALGPDGLTYFTCDINGNDEIYRFVGDSSAVERMTDPSRGYNWNPTVGPGSELYFTSDRDGAREIYRLDRTRGSAVRITHPDYGECWEPTMGPNQEIYFTCDRDGSRQIYHIDHRNGKVVRMTDPSSGENWGAVLGPLDQLYFTSDRSGKREVFRIDRSTGKVTQMTNTADGESWTRDEE